MFVVPTSLLRAQPDVLVRLFVYRTRQPDALVRLFVCQRCVAVVPASLLRAQPDVLVRLFVYRTCQPDILVRLIASFRLRHLSGSTRHITPPFGKGALVHV